jgi:peptidoglycan/LPS O-acetylase OafA/YrhL
MDGRSCILRALPERLARRMSSRAGYRPEIDGLRFLAIAVVVLGHLAERVARFQEARGAPSELEATVFRVLAVPWPGVMLFFAVSGLVITQQFLARSEPPLSGRFLRAYFTRRALRIEPPYLLLITATFVAVSLGLMPEGVRRFDSAPSSLTTSFLASLAYAHGWLFGTLPRLFTPGWSLEIEIQFYVLAPLLFHLYFKAGPRGLALFWALLAASLAIALACRAEVLGVHWYFTVFRFAVFFILGSGFAVFRKEATAFVGSLPKVVTAWAPWLGLALLTLPDALWPGEGWRETLRVLCQVAATALLVGGAHVERSAFRRFCSGRWIGLLGAACYSIYLTHLQVLHVGAGLLSRIFRFDSWFLALAADAALLLPLAVVVGLVFYAMVERTFMLPDWPARAWRLVRRGRTAQAPAE